MKRPLYNAIHSLFCDPRHFVAALLYRFGGWIPDKIYLKIIFWLNLKTTLNLENPQTYQEKLQWLKLYYQYPELTILVDKYEVKQFISNIIGEKYVIPTYAHWSTPEEIDWDILPDQFVLKTNHDSGNFGIFICDNKSQINKNKAIHILNQSLRRDSFKLGREWPYKNINRCVFAERYLEDISNGELLDYKFFCFHGKPRFLYVASGRQKCIGNARFDYFDMEFNHIDLLQTGRKKSGTTIKKPECFEEMVSVVEKLSSVLINNSKIPHVRIDLYEVNGKIYFGEYTFFHSGGLAEYTPKKYNKIFGDYITLPEKHIETKL